MSNELRDELYQPAVSNLYLAEAFLRCGRFGRFNTKYRQIQLGILMFSRHISYYGTGRAILNRSCCRLRPLVMELLSILVLLNVVADIFVIDHNFGWGGRGQTGLANAHVHIYGGAEWCATMQRCFSEKVCLQQCLLADVVA